MPKLVNDPVGWPFFQKLLIALLRFLEPYLRNAELTDSVRLLYKGTLRVLLVLLHDFPEFLCEYHFEARFSALDFSCFLGIHIPSFQSMVQISALPIFRACHLHKAYCSWKLCPTHSLAFLLRCATLSLPAASR